MILEIGYAFNGDDNPNLPRRNFTGGMNYSQQSTGAGGFAGSIGDINTESSSPRGQSPFQFMPIPLESPILPDHYILGVGDVLELRLSGRTIQTFPVEINLSGQACLPSNECIKAYGATITELAQMIQKIIKINYKDTNSTLHLVNTRTVALTVSGEVEVPGIYSARITDRVTKIINMAGGITSKASKVNIYIDRKGTHIPVNLEEFEYTGNTNSNPFIREGDVIFIPLKKGSINISGEVKRKGEFEVREGETLCYVLTKRAGGFTSSTSFEEPIKILRINEDDAHKTKIHYNASGCKFAQRDELILKGGDEVYVPSIETMQRIVIVRGAVLGSVSKEAQLSTILGGSPGSETYGVYPLGTGETVRDIVNRAGGVTPYADLTHAFIERTKGKKRTIIDINLEKILIDRDTSYDKELKPGDILNIPSKDFAVYVTGEVKNARAVPYREEITVQEYLALSGGPSQRADMGDIELIKKNGKVFDIDDNPKIEPGDTIHVNEMYFKFWQDYLTIVLSITSLTFSILAVF